MELKTQQELSGRQIHLKRKTDGQWKALVPNVGIPFEPSVTGEGATVIEALAQLIGKLAQVPHG